MSKRMWFGLVENSKPLRPFNALFLNIAEDHFSGEEPQLSQSFTSAAPLAVCPRGNVEQALYFGSGHTDLRMAT